jgi:DNA-binding LytR/AlgR family response regulator
MSASLSILLVEGDPVSARRTATMIHEMQFELCDEAATATQASALIRKHNPDLVICDIHLQDGQLGFQLAETTRGPGIPLVLITAKVDSGTYRRVQEVQPAGFLVKPFDRYTLQSAIETAVARRDRVLGSPKRDAALRHDVWGEFIFVKSNNIIHKIRLREILYVQAEGNYCTIVTAGKRLAVKMSLPQIREILDSGAVVQVHRNYLVRLSEIDSISLTDNEISIQGFTVPISRQKFRDDLLSNLKLLR